MSTQRGRVMGTDAQVIVVGGSPSLADDAFARLTDLEARWTRFRDDSELMRINARAGSPCVASTDTVHLVALLVQAWRDTNGRFDPTQRDALVALGYDRSWPFADADGAATPHPARGCSEVQVDARTGMVWLPAGLALDAGGLGKGLAADIVTRELLDAGAEGALVNVGGDLRAVGASPDDGPWIVDVEHPEDRARKVARVALLDGGIATTSRRYRRWQTADGTEAHHLLDPSDGLPADRYWASATVVAATGWQAEAWAKVAFLDGALAPAARGAVGLLLDETGAPTLLGAAAPDVFSLAEEVAA